MTRWLFESPIGSFGHYYCSALITEKYRSDDHYCEICLLETSLSCLKNHVIRLPGVYLHFKQFPRLHSSKALVHSPLYQHRLDRSITNRIMARNTGGGSSSSGGRKRSAPFSSASFHKTPSSSSTAGPSRREKAKLKGRPVKPLPNADEGDLDDADGNHTRTRTDKKGKKRSREEDIDPLNVYDYDPLSSSSTSKNKSSQKAKDSSNRFTLSKDEAKYVGFNRRKPYRGGDGNDGSDDDRGGGEDEDSDEEMVKRIKKAARTIAGEGSFKIRASSRAGQDNDEEEDVDGDDSDIDSDEAFEGGESGEDEEKWGDVFRKLGGGSGVAKGKKNMVSSLICFVLSILVAVC